MTATKPLPTSLKMFHGMGAIAYGVKDSGFGTFLLIFYNQVIGIEAWLVSMALMIAMLVDAFVDPVIGHLSDRTYSRWGRRLPWLYLAPIPLALAWTLLWSPPQGLGNGVIIYLIVSAIIVRVLVSAYEIPAASLVPELTADYDERTQIVRFRYLFAWAAGLLMVFLAYGVFLVPDAQHATGQLNEEGYWKFGLTGAALILVSTLISAAGQHKRAARTPLVRLPKISVAHAFGEIRESLGHRAALILISGAVLLFSSQGLSFAISNYLYLYGWQFPQGAFTLYPLLLLATVITAFFIVTPLTKVFGKKAVLLLAWPAGGIVMAIPYILYGAGFWPETGTFASTAIVFAVAFVTNSLIVTTMITAQSMVADLVEASEIVTGRRSEGVFSAGWFFAQKCGQGIGIFICGIILQLCEFPAKAVPGKVDGYIIERLFLSYAAAIIIIVIGVVLIFRHFPIGRTDHEERLRQLAQK